MSATIRPRQGTPITLREASRRYGILPRTLSRWAARGIVTVLASSPSRGYPLILDEHSVAHIADLYHQDPGQGKRTVIGRSGEAHA